MTWEFFGVLLPHIASVLYEFVVCGTVILGKGHLKFSEHEVSDIADIARNDVRSSKEAIASYSRHFGFSELVADFFRQGVLLVILNFCSMLGVYFEEIWGGKQDSFLVWATPAGRVLIVFALGGVSIHCWNGWKSHWNFKSQVRWGLSIIHLTTLVAVIVTALGSASIWRLAHP